jgi:hypothetical protein
VAGDWRRLHNEELHTSYASPNIVRAIKSRRNRCAGHAARMREMRNAYILNGKHERKRQLTRPRRRLEYNIRMDLREIKWENVDWIHLAYVREQWRVLINTVMNLQFP